jgi:hypothetical protein
MPVEATLPEKWRTAFANVAREARSDDLPSNVDGSWTLSVEGLSAPGILGMLPGEYVRVVEQWDEMCDDSGECVEFEGETCIWASDDERAIFSYYDHWQAGLSGAVTVYPDANSYVAAREQVIRESRADEIERASL